MSTERPTTAGSDATTDALRAQLVSLKLPHLLEHFESLGQQAGAEAWPHVEYLARLIEGEAQQRENRSIQRRVALARFPVLKTLDQFDWGWPKKINRPLDAIGRPRCGCGMARDSSMRRLGMTGAMRPTN